MPNPEYAGTFVFHDKVKIQANLQKKRHAIEFIFAFDWPPGNRRYSAHATAKLVKSGYVTSWFHCKELLTGYPAVEFSSFRIRVEQQVGGLKVDGTMKESGQTHRFSGVLEHVR